MLFGASLLLLAAAYVEGLPSILRARFVPRLRATLQAVPQPVSAQQQGPAPGGVQHRDLGGVTVGAGSQPAPQRPRPAAQNCPLGI